MEQADKAIKWSVVAGIVLISLSVFYYFVIFLSQKEQRKIELERTMQEQKEQKEKTEERLRIVKQSQLQECLDEVTNRFSNALKDKKTMGYEETRIVIDLFQKQKDECFRKYPQN